jgi:hypothetical protein
MRTHLPGGYQSLRGLVPCMPLKPVCPTCCKSVSFIKCQEQKRHSPSTTEIAAPISGKIELVMIQSSSPTFLVITTLAHIRARYTMMDNVKNTITRTGPASLCVSGLVWFGAGQDEITSDGAFSPPLRRKRSACLLRPTTSAMGTAVVLLLGDQARYRWMAVEEE